MNLRNALTEVTVADAGYQEDSCIGATRSVREAVEYMRTQHTGTVLVVEEGRLVGIFTERDLLVRVIGAGASLDDPLRQHCTKKPTSIRAHVTLGQALGVMARGRFRNLPVLDDAGHPLGYLSLKRALQYVAECMPGTVYNLPPEPNVYPSTVEGG